MICLAVKYRMKSGKEMQGRDVLNQLAAESRKEPGCRLYVVHTNPAERLEIFLYEQYDDDTAVARHRASAHFKLLAENSLAPLFETRELTVYRSE